MGLAISLVSEVKEKVVICLLLNYSCNMGMCVIGRQFMSYFSTNSSKKFGHDRVGDCDQVIC